MEKSFLWCKYIEHYITLRVTKEQKTEIEKRAAQNNMSINKYAVMSMLEQMDYGPKFPLCQILAKLLTLIDRMPDSKKKDKLKKEYGEIWQSLK